jgi:hypothetical protein
MARTSASTKLQEAIKLREKAEESLRRAAQIEEAVITPTRNKLRDIMYERVDKFLRENIASIGKMKIDKDKFAEAVDLVLRENFGETGNRESGERTGVDRTGTMGPAI